jgi:hypothetical protein
MAKKVILELSETQARTVLAAVEEWFRLRMGQETDLADGLVFLNYKRDDHNFDSAIQRRNAVIQVIRAMFRIAWPLYGTPGEIPPEVHVASDIWSALRWELSEKGEWDRTPFQMGPEPMPKITVEDTECQK